MLKTLARAPRRRQEAHGRPDSWLDKLDRMKDAVVLAVALLGLGALFAMESTNAERKLAEGEPLKGNSPAVLTCILAVSGSVLGWRRGKAAPAARKLDGLPSVDPVRLVQHDVFNLVLLPVLMVINVCVWMDVVDAYVYTILFSMCAAPPRSPAARSAPFAPRIAQASALQVHGDGRGVHLGAPGGGAAAEPGARAPRLRHGAALPPAPHPGQRHLHRQRRLRRDQHHHPRRPAPFRDVARGGHAVPQRLPARDGRCVLDDLLWHPLRHPPVDGARRVVPSAGAHLRAPSHRQQHSPPLPILDATRRGQGR